MEEKIIQAEFAKERVIAKNNDLTRKMYDKSSFGEPLDKNNFQYSLLEALYLIENKKMVVKTTRKELDFDNFRKKAQKIEPNFWIRYVVFRNMRSRGYILKSAFKFGADFRVYDRGIKPGQDHAKWILYPVAETEVTTWYEFSAKNRVAHSTRKRLLIGVVGEENDVTYYEIKWVRP